MITNSARGFQKFLKKFPEISKEISMYTTDLGVASISTSLQLTVDTDTYTESRSLIKLCARKHTFIALEIIDHVMVIRSFINGPVTVDGFLSSSFPLDYSQIYVLVNGRITQNNLEMIERVKDASGTSRTSRDVPVVVAADSNADIDELLHDDCFSGGDFTIIDANVKLSQLPRCGRDQKIVLRNCMIDPSQHSCGIVINLVRCGFSTRTCMMPEQVRIYSGFILDNLTGERSKMISKKIWIDSLLLSPKLMQATVPGLIGMSRNDAVEYLKALPDETLSVLIDMPLEKDEPFS